MMTNYRYLINIMLLPNIINLLEPFATLISWTTKTRIKKRIIFLQVLKIIRKVKYRGLKISLAQFTAVDFFIVWKKYVFQVKVTV